MTDGSAATGAAGLLGLGAVGDAAAVAAALAHRRRPYLPSGLTVALNGPRQPLTGTP